MKKEKPAKILTTKNLLLYAFGIFGLQLFIGYVNSYQAQFYTSVYGANLMVVAAIILAAKIISGLADFIIGNVIDGSNLKGGKMRPFVFISAFPLAILSTVMFVFIPFSSKIGMYVYVSFITVLWNVAMSFADIPSQGLLSLLSPDANERNGAANLANILRSVALAAPGLIVPVICLITGSDGIGKKEYFIAALFILVVGFSLHFLMGIKVKENVANKKAERATIKEMFAELKSNKMIFILFLTFMLGFGRNIQMGIAVQAAAVMIRDGVDVTVGTFRYVAAGENLAWLVGAMSAVSSTIILLTVSAINKKWGEKKTFIVFAVFGAVVALTSFVLYAVGGKIFRSVWAILIYQFLIGFSFGPNGFLPLVMTGDIVEYREWQTGKRTEGLQFAILSMSNKLSNALSVAVGIFIVGASGYVGSLSPEAITDKMQTIVAFAYFGMLGISMLLSMIPMFWYKIDAKTKLEMRKSKPLAE